MRLEVRLRFLNYIQITIKFFIMGWKSTIDITREEAIRLAINAMSKVYTMSDSELEDFIEELGYGDTPGMEYFGHNFNIINK